LRCITLHILAKHKTKSVSWVYCVNRVYCVYWVNSEDQTLFLDIQSLNQIMLLSNSLWLIEESNFDKKKGLRDQVLFLDFLVYLVFLFYLVNLVSLVGLVSWFSP